MAESDPPAPPESPAEPEDVAAPKEDVEAAKPPTPSREARLRRLHSASGAIPLAVFLVEHIWTNASALGGSDAYDRIVGSIEHFSLLPLIELVFIIIPLFFHAGVGVWLAKKGRTEAALPPYSRNRWFYQRASGIVVLVFVLAHLWELRLQKLFFGLSADAFHTKLSEHLGSTYWGVPWIAFGYLLGIAASTLHFSNGLIAAAKAWNVAKTPNGEKRLSIALGALGVLLFVVGCTTVIGLSTGMRLTSNETKTGPCGSLVPSARVAPPPASQP